MDLLSCKLVEAETVIAPIFCTFRHHGNQCVSKVFRICSRCRHNNLEFHFVLVHHICVAVVRRIMPHHKIEHISALNAYAWRNQPLVGRDSVHGPSCFRRHCI